LNLVDRWELTSFFRQAFDVFWQELRDSDLAHEAAITGIDKRLPCRDLKVLARTWPVDQQQIQVIHAEPVKAFFDSGAREVEFMKAAGQFTSHDEFIARHTGFAQRYAHRAFVFIVVGGIDQPVASLYR